MKDEYSGFIDYVSRKNVSSGHKTKLLGYAKNLSNYTHFFNYKDLVKVKDKLSADGFYKAIRVLCNYLEEKYIDSEDVIVELNKIRKLIKKPKYNPDIYTPSDEQLQETLDSLKKMNPDFHGFYLALMFSGVRIREMVHYIQSKDFKIIENGSYYKVLLNYKRNTKNVFYLYFPKWFKPPSKMSVKYLSKFLVDNKEIIRTKYLRNWFYSKCLDLDVPAAIADFYQGRVPVTIGNRHYLDKEKMADRIYAEKLEPYFRSWIER